MRFDELAVGTAAELQRTVTEEDVVAFAAVSGDTNPAHLDEQAARRGRFGARIAHGMLSASYISAVIGAQLPGPGSIYMRQALRFVQPVYLGDTVTVRVEVMGVVAEKRRVQLATRCFNQRGELVLDGEALVWVPEDAAAAQPQPLLQ